MPWERARTARIICHGLRHDSRAVVRAPSEDLAMKKLVLAGLLGLLVVLVAGLLMWLRVAPSGQEAARGGEHSQTAATSTDETLQGDAATLQGDAQASHAERTQAPESAADALGDSARKTLKGHVLVRQTCEDATRQIFALDQALGTSSVLEELEPAPADDAADREDAADFGFGELDRNDKTPKHILAQAPIGASGEFEIAVPAARERVWLIVVGRYQYVERALEVDLRRDSGPLSITAECGACVLGSVRLPASAPDASVDGERVSTSPSAAGFGNMEAMQRDVRRATRISKSSFELRALPADLAYELRLTPKHLAAASQKLEGLRGGADTNVEVRLLAGGTVRGVVLGPDGKPVGGARVRARTAGQWFGFDDRTVRSTKSNDDGSFEVANVTPGRIGMQARHERFLEGEDVKIDVKDEGITNGVTLTFGEGNTISGIVHWPDGSPVEAKIEVSFDMSQMAGMTAFNARRGASGSAKSDATGAFVVEGLGKGPFSVRARAKPKSTATEGAAQNAPAAAPEAEAKDAPKDEVEEWRARVDGVTPGTKDLELVLRPGEGVRGRVTAQNGAPVVKFKIQAQRVGKGMLATLGQESHEKEFESAEGRFLLTGLSSGEWKIFASAEGFGPLDPTSLELPRPAVDPTQPASIDELVFVLPPACTVRGVVKDPLGALVADAEVRVDDGGPGWARFAKGGPEAPTARSRADGTFEITGLKPAQQNLTAKTRDFARSAPLQVDLSTATELSDVVIMLRQGGLLTGEVFTDTGEPGKGWLVQCTDTTNFDQRMSFSDDSGKFRIEHLEPGKRQVVAMPTSAITEMSDGMASASGGAEDTAGFMNKMKIAFTELVDGEETHLVLGAAVKGAVTVTGKVTHANEPYAGAMISFVYLGKSKARMGFKTASVKASGEYSVTLDGPGEYTISVQKFGAKGPMQQGVIEFVRDVPEGEKATLDFEIPTGRISGRVRAEDGAVIANARVSLHPETNSEPGSIWGGQYNETSTDDEGRFDVEALRPGTYEVLAGGMTMGGMFGDDAHGGREVKSGVRLSAGEWVKDIEFRLKKPGTLDVVVVDESGAAVSKASIFVRTSRGELLDRMSLLSTDSDGKCAYGGIAPGRYTVSARDKTRASGDSAEVEVRSGEHASARIVMSAGCFLMVEVVDAEKKALRASLSVKDEAGREYGGMFSLAEIMELFTEGGGSAGERKVGPLPAGKYRIVASTGVGNSTTKSVTVSGGGERKLTIRL